jgi:mannose/cellobiose epimerase-like protein (N-acyl-D-glucosamine 2-epimerase family)
MPHEPEFHTIRGWLLDAAAPFWIEHGIDAGGLAYEELDFTGRPVETGVRRSMVQFRQVHALARLARDGGGDGDVAHRLFQRAAAASWHPDGGFVHALDDSGAVRDPTRRTYDQAFALLACAATHGDLGDAASLDRAHATLRFLDDELAGPDGGYRDATGTAGRRCQNPHMHLFEAFLALVEVTGDERFAARADAMLDLLERRFVTADGALREHFEEDWEPAQGPDGAVAEPGHHFEWVWLLHEHARLTRTPVRDVAGVLFDFATAHGLDRNGRPMAAVGLDGAPIDASVKLWAVAEQLKAHVARAEAAGTIDDPVISSIVADLHARFLLADPPLWFEELDPSGAPTRRRMPASTLYHLVVAGAELQRFGR